MNTSERFNYVLAFMNFAIALTNITAGNYLASSFSLFVVVFGLAMGLFFTFKRVGKAAVLPEVLRNL